MYSVRLAVRTDIMLCYVRIHLAVVRQAQLVLARVWAPLMEGANSTCTSIHGASTPLAPEPVRP